MLDKTFKLFPRKKKQHEIEGRKHVLYSIEFIKLEQKKQNKARR